MSNQLVITSGAKVRNLEGVLTGTSGVVNSLPINASNGVPQLDSNGKILVSQLPNSVMEYKGTWNVATNTPYLVNGVGNQGDVYLVEGAATTGTSHDFGAGAITFYNGDQAIYSGSIWQRASGATGSVTSVGLSTNGGAITISNSPITTSGTIAFNFNGTSGQYVNGAGNLVTFPTTIAQAQRLITEVYNETGATLTKGTVVYINGGHGNLPTVTKAIATGDATSAQTYGVVQTDITDNNNGYVVVIGSLGDLDTQAYPNGTQLYLSSTTAGAWTSVKQYAPAHLVYVGIVVRSHPTQGVVEIRIQNGFELDELHNVSAQTPSNNQGLFYNSSNQLWENKSIATALGYTPANDALVVHLAGTETITGIKTFSNGLNTDYIGITGDMTMDGSFLLKHVAYGTLQSGYTNLSGQTNGLRVGLFGGYNALLNFSTSGSYNYTFPAASGTVALLEFSQTFSGLQSFTNTAGTDLTYGAYLTKNSIPSAFSSTTVNLYSASGNNNLVIRDNGNTSKLQFQATSSYTYTFPALTGTLALTSDLTNYVNLTTAQTIGGTKTFSDAPKMDGSLFLKIGATSSTTGYMNLGGRLNGIRFTSDGGTSNDFNLPSLTGYSFTFPNASGTVALTSDLSAYVTLATAQTISGDKTFSASVINDDGLKIKFGSASNLTANYLTLSAYGLTSPSRTVLRLGTTATTLSELIFSQSNSFQYTFPALTGTLALTSDIPSLAGYVPYTGATGSVNLGAYNLTATNIFVNTTDNSSGSKLQVFGSINFKGNSGYNGWIISQAGGNSSAAFNLSYGSGGASNVITAQYDTGNVGINTTTDSGYKLDVNGTGRFSGTTNLVGKVTLNSSTSMTQTKLNILATLGVGAYGSPMIGMFDGTSSPNGFDFGLETLSTGNFFLNRVVADVRYSVLEVNRGTGAATFSSSVAINGTFVQYPSSGSGGFYIDRGTSGGSPYISWLNGSGTRLGYMGYSNTNIGLYLENSANFVVTGGNVGIGSSTFNYSASGRGYLSIGGSSDSLLEFQNSGTNTSGYILGTSTNLQIQISGPKTLSLNPNGGNVLIGTTTDSGQKLQVNGTILAGGSIKIPSTSYFIGNATYGYRFNNEADSATLMTILNGGNVLIGTTADRGFKFLVEGTDNNNLMGSYNTTSGASLRMQSNQTVNYIVSATNQLQFEVGSAIRMAMPTSGNILIGTTTDDGGRLTVKAAGNTSSNYAIVVRSSTADLFYARGDGYINTGLQSLSPYYNSISGRAMIVDSGGGLGYTSSTRESKINIENLNDVSWLLKLNPVSYNYRKKDNNNNYTNEAQNERWYGLIADETEPINSDLVFYNEIDNNKKLAGVEYNKLIAPMLKLLQEQQAQIQELKQLINK